MGSLGLSAPELLAFSRRRVLQTFDGIPVRDLSHWLFKTLQAHRKLVIKPVKGHKARGLFFLELQKGEMRINGQSAESTEVVSMLQNSSDFVITEFIEQANYARAIYPRTSNTIRVLTIWDYALDQPFIVAAAQRIGTERSYPADNWLAGLGGLSSEVDLRTGLLGKGAMVSSDWKLVWCKTHPDSHAPIEGTIVPGWAEIEEQLVGAARRLAWIPIIAWDILVTNSGFTVIETNGTPGLPVHQVHGPLLTDPRARNFYRVHQVIK
jgi:hypothetical protein